MSEEAQQTVNTLISQNETLLKELQQTSIQLEIMSGATDAINPKDIIPFVNMDSLKIDKKTGKVIGGITEEMTRIRTEKPYLFQQQQQQNQNSRGRGGFDPSSGNPAGGNNKVDMNAAIRKAAFGGSRSF
jgi:hypothetical protein